VQIYFKRASCTHVAYIILFLWARKSMQKEPHLQVTRITSFILITLIRKTHIEFTEITLSRCTTNLICLITLAHKNYNSLCGSHNSHKSPSSAYLEPRTQKHYPKSSTPLKSNIKSPFCKLFRHGKAKVSRAFQKREPFLLLFSVMKKVGIKRRASGVSFSYERR